MNRRETKMVKRERLKRAILWGCAIFIIPLVFLGYQAQKWPERELSFSGTPKKIILVVDGEEVIYPSVLLDTVRDFFVVYDIEFGNHDVVYANLEDPLYGGERIYMEKAKNISLSVGEELREVITTARTAKDLIREENIEKGEDDFVLPGEYSRLEDGMKVSLVRVRVVNEVEEKTIPFKTVQEEDNDMGWQEKKILQKGRDGAREKKYRVVYHNGEMVKKTLLEERTTKESVTEKIVQGTYVKLGKKHTGWSTWYAWTGTLAAASPWLPIGSHAKVTNKANGKSVIVVINDRGPFGANRIIDLDKVAFEKIAPLGAGVIDVKVEEILN